MAIGKKMGAALIFKGSCGRSFAAMPGSFRAQADRAKAHSSAPKICRHGIGPTPDLQCSVSVYGLLLFQLFAGVVNRQR